MATATAILNEKYKSKDGTYPIVIRLIDGKRQKLHPIKYKVSKQYWKDGQVTDKHPEADIINSIIDEELLAAKRYFRDCRLDNVPIDLELVFKAVKSHSFTAYLLSRSAQHKEAGELEFMFKSKRFAKELTLCFGRDIYFSEVNQELLRTYDAWLKKDLPEIDKKANNPNTRNKKFEFLGKYYANAISDGKAREPNPFKEYQIKTTPVKKEKITIEQLKAIEALPLRPGPAKLARDIFLFSYYCKGLRFENCICMPKSAIINGRLHYTINKGLRHLSTRIHPKLQAIIDQYINNHTDTIFGRFSLKDIIDKQKKRSKVGSENAYLNNNLKDVALLAEVPVQLSFHLARHAFAYHMKKVSSSIYEISDALGHARTATTETYLKSLDDEHIDEVVSRLYE
jgi:site-specific recombinase XerD